MSARRQDLHDEYQGANLMPRKNRPYGWHTQPFSANIRVLCVCECVCVCVCVGGGDPARPAGGEGFCQNLSSAGAVALCGRKSEGGPSTGVARARLTSR